MKTTESKDFNILRDKVLAGDRHAIGQLLQSQRPFLLRYVKKNLDPRLAARLDPNDVAQDIYVTATQTLRRYLQTPSIDFKSWLEAIADDEISRTHERHLHTGKRSVRREERWPADDPATQKARRNGRAAFRELTPSGAAMRAERETRVSAALHKLSLAEQHILKVRFYDRQRPKETAKLLGITENAVRKRQLTAFDHLKAFLSEDLL